LVERIAISSSHISAGLAILLCVLKRRTIQPADVFAGTPEQIIAHHNSLTKYSFI